MERNLDGCDLLGELPRSDLRALEAKCKWSEFAPDEIILDQDAESVDVYFIVAGTVRATTGAGDGQEVVLADLKVGSFSGEVSAIDNRGRSARIVSREPSVIAVLGRDDFRAMLVEHPKVALKLLENFAGIVRRKDRPYLIGDYAKLRTLTEL